MYVELTPPAGPFKLTRIYSSCFYSILFGLLLSLRLNFLKALCALLYNTRHVILRSRQGNLALSGFVYDIV